MMPRRQDLHLAILVLKVLLIYTISLSHASCLGGLEAVGSVTAMDTTSTSSALSPFLSN